MLQLLVRRSLALAAVATLVLSGTVLADGVAADGDTAAGPQTFVDLGTVSPGEEIARDVSMILSCSGIRHVDPGQIVSLWQASVTVPLAGGSISATGTTVGPVPPEWANDTAGPSGCLGLIQVTSAVPSKVTIIAPSTPGLDYAFSVTYGRTLTPAGVSDASSVSGFTIVSFILDVEEGAAPDVTPPVIDGMPGDMALVTGDPAGATLDYALPTATDDQDPAPVVACDPAPGALVPVGTTTVTCTATDAAGNAASESFEVVVLLVTVEWGDPVGGDAAVTVALGRSLPLKARAWLDGVLQAGPATFEVWSCAARSTGAERSAAASWNADAARWMTVLDTSGLTVGCHTVSLVHGGTTLGSFALEVIDPPAPGPAVGQAAGAGPAKGPPPRRR
jgi:hypothetical protein